MSAETIHEWEALAWASTTPSEPPRVPFHVLAGEALDVARFCQRYWQGPGDGTPTPGLSSAVGNGAFDERIAEEILEIVEAFQNAQTRYQLLLTRTPAAPMARAHFVLREIRRTLGWLFAAGTEHTPVAQLAKLAAAHDGAASQDAVAAALHDFAELASRHEASMSGLGGFDPQLIEEARSLATALREQSAGPPVDSPAVDERDALELRNRLGNLLSDRIRRVRAAARFVFRGHPELVRQVTSAYGRRQRAASRRRTMQEAETGPALVRP